MSSFDEWLASRPQVIQDLAREYPPDQKYRLISTGQIGYLYSYDENGTMTINFPRAWNPQQFEGDRQVFGIPPADLERFLEA